MKASRIALAASIVLMGAALAGCDSGGSAPGVTVLVTASPSPSVVASATPTPSPAPTGHTYVFGDEWTLAPATEAQGSGCTPGVGLLPDGVWFGLVTTWSTSEIAFDLACWWTGDAAHAKGVADGVEDGYDYYISNDNTTVRLVTVAGDVPAKKAAWDDGVFTLSQVMADPGGTLPTSEPYPVWIYVNGGVITEVAVQYVP